MLSLGLWGCRIWVGVWKLELGVSEWGGGFGAGNFFNLMGIFFLLGYMVLFVLFIKTFLVFGI